MKRIMILLLIAITLLGCTEEELEPNVTIKPPQEKINETIETGEIMEKITLTTKDNVQIIANYWKGNEKGVLLLHMMPATKESWDEFANKLHEKGYSVLAIDLRGHGESGGSDYKSFTDEQHQASSLDVESAVEYLKGNGVTELSIAGASIGANLALQYQGNNLDVKKSILMSPGTNYRGITTTQYALKIIGSQNVYLLGGKNDGNSEKMVKEIANYIKGDTTVKILESSAHGTNLFNEFPELLDELAEWI
ncbi:alpha/beta hydrolase [Nanoarchaeota archaeon]